MSLPASETTRNGVRAALVNSYRYIVDGQATQVLTGRGVLVSIHWAPTAGAAINVFDNTSASVPVFTGSLATVTGSMVLNCRVNTGIHVTFTGTPPVTIIYRAGD